MFAGSDGVKEPITWSCSSATPFRRRDRVESAHAPSGRCASTEDAPQCWTCSRFLTAENFRAVIHFALLEHFAARRRDRMRCDEIHALMVPPHGGFAGRPAAPPPRYSRRGRGRSRFISCFVESSMNSEDLDIAQGALWPATRFAAAGGGAAVLGARRSQEAGGGSSEILHLLRRRRGSRVTPPALRRELERACGVRPRLSLLPQWDRAHDGDLRTFGWDQRRLIAMFNARGRHCVQPPGAPVGDRRRSSAR